MKWKSKDFKRKYYKIGKSMSQAKKILYNKFKKKSGNSKKSILKKSMLSDNKFKVFKINSQEQKISIN